MVARPHERVTHHNIVMVARSHVRVTHHSILRCQMAIIYDNSEGRNNTIASIHIDHMFDKEAFGLAFETRRGDAGATCIDVEVQY